jgi:hypothetical protein
MLKEGSKMRFPVNSIRIAFIVAAVAAAAINVAAQSPVIQGPILGFISDSGGVRIWPVIGIPGAAMPSDPLQFETDIRGAIISPMQDYAVAVRSSDRQAVVIDITANPPVTVPVAGVSPGADVIAISPTGAAAAVYDQESNTVQVIGDLPHAPGLVWQFDTSSFPGRGTALSVSDDATIVLAKFVDTDSVGLWVLNSSGASWRIPLDAPSTATFFPNRLDAVILDEATHAAFLVVDVGNSATQIPLISAPEGIDRFSAVSTSEDGRRVFLADANSGNIVIVDVESRIYSLVSCQCQPTGLHRLRGPSIFQLNDASSGPVAVLDASSDEGRIRLIPPNTSISQ